jgi:hypothetical protein
MSNVPGPNIAFSATGAPLSQGPPGPPGPQGLPGPTGLQGVAGPGVMANLIPVTRGLTFSLQASAGVLNVSGKGPYWRDQSPGHVGRRFFDTTGNGGATIGTSINSRPTLDFSSTGGGQRYFDPNVATSGTIVTFSPEEFSIGAVVKYTGATNLNTGTMGVMPTIVGDNIGTFNPPHSLGLSCGLDSGNTTMVQFCAWIYNGSIQAVVAADVLASAAHYVVVTFALGVLSIYVDAAPAVTLGSLGTLQVALETGSSVPSIGGNGISTSGSFIGSILEVDGWNVCQTPTEISLSQAWLKAAGGL